VIYQSAYRILEQSYRNVPVSQAMVLSLFEGKTLEFVRREPNKPDRVVTGKVVRSGFVPGGAFVGPIIGVDGKLQFSLPGEPVFPSLGTDNILKPTLNWKLNSAFRRPDLRRDRLPWARVLLGSQLQPGGRRKERPGRHRGLGDDEQPERDDLQRRQDQAAGGRCPSRGTPEQPEGLRPGRAGGGWRPWPTRW